MAIRSKPPLDLAVEVTDAQGTRTRWGSDSRSVGDVPSGISFHTKRGDGFADGPEISLQRRMDRDYPDINLYDEVRLVGSDGSVAYEGYISANPRSFDGGHKVGVRVAGPMTLAQHLPFSEIYIDRDLSRWTGPTVRQQAVAINATFAPSGGSNTPDPSGTPSLATSCNGPWTNPGMPWVQAWYFAANGVKIGHLSYEWVRGDNVDATNTNWAWDAYLSDDDTLTLYDQTFNLRGSGPGDGVLDASTTTRTAAAVDFYFSDANAVYAVEFAIYWQNLAVIGTHGLTLQASSTPGPGGLLASDMITDICRRFTPLDPSGVRATTYPVDQMTFENVQPYDAWLALNKFHLWELAVWENRVLHYYPADLSDYDWQIRLDDPGVTVDLPGASTEQLANGAIVSYLDITTGLTEVLTPDTNPELADPDPTNPATLHGFKVWLPVDLSSLPLSAADASQIGQVKLQENNQAKAAGTIKFQGHIRDRAGNWQPGWKVRASDTIAIVNHPDDRPRLIGETTWDHDSLTCTVAVDNTLNRMDAYLDRVVQAEAAANVGTFPTG